MSTAVGFLLVSARNSKGYEVMRANVTQEERGFISEYHEQSEPQGEAHWSEGLGICDPRDYTNSTVTRRNPEVLDP